MTEPIVRLTRQVDLFMLKVRVAASSCWEWTGAIEKRGYGCYGNFRAHRIAYNLFVGPLIPGETIDHLCRNRRCVRPDHLEQVSIGENVLRGSGVTAINAQKTHCHRGHPLSGTNLKIKDGWRICRACAKQHQHDYVARKRTELGL